MSLIGLIAKSERNHGLCISSRGKLNTETETDGDFHRHCSVSDRIVQAINCSVYYIKSSSIVGTH